MGKFSVLLGGLLFLVACQPPSGQAPVVKPSVVSPSPVVSPLPSASGSLVPTPSPIQSLDKGPSSRPVEVVAGTGAKCFQDGAAKQATFIQLRGSCFDPKSGDMYVIDTNSIRKLSKDGQVTTIAGSEEAGFQDGSMKTARFNQPQDCVVDAQGQVFISDYRNHRIRLLSMQNGVSTLLGAGEAVSKDGDAKEAGLAFPQNLAMSLEGKLYFSEPFKIRLFADGKVATLNKHQKNAIVDRFTYRDGDILAEATFGANLSFSLNAQNEVFIADSDLKIIRKLGIDGRVSTLSTPISESDRRSLIPGAQDIVYLQDLEKWIIAAPFELYQMDKAGNINLISINQINGEEPIPNFKGIISICAVNKNEVYIIDSFANQVKSIKF
ncbi:MAG: hypothetical protein AB7I41_04365, partial [Candidatus Sericytochromatia bacterium]